MKFFSEEGMERFRAGFAKWMETKRGQRIAATCLILVFLVSGVLSIFLQTVIRVRYRIELWDLDDTGAYVRLEVINGGTSDYGVIDGAFSDIMITHRAKEMYTVKAMPAPGYRLWCWQDGIKSAVKQSWLHTNVYESVRFMPDRESDVLQLTFRKNGTLLASGVGRWVDGEALYYGQTLGKYKATELPGGGTLLRFSKEELYVFGETSACILYPVTSETALEFYRLLSAWCATEEGQAQGGQVQFVEWYDQTSYQGLCIAYTCDAIQEPGEVKAEENTLASAFGKLTGGGSFGYEGSAGSASVPFFGSLTAETNALTAEEKRLLVANRELYVNAELSILPRALNRLAAYERGEWFSPHPVQEVFGTLPDEEYKLLCWRYETELVSFVREQKFLQLSKNKEYASRIDVLTEG